MIRARLHRTACRRVGASAAALALASPMVAAAQHGVPGPPDYTEPRAWMLREAGVAGRTSDVFYIHPTTSQSTAWNADAADPETNRSTDLSAGERQASAFASCCRRFAPRYRQATMHALTGSASERDKAFALAYEDVRRAFRSFLATSGGDRPFILVGHSQGAQHGLRLLREEIAGTPAAKRLVVAYLPGIGIPANALPSGIDVCTSPQQTGCVVSWNSFTPQADTASYVARSLARHGSPESAQRVAPLICVNPVSFSQAHAATTKVDALGAMPWSPETGPAPALKRGAVSAACDDNVLRVRIEPGLSVETLPGGSLHMADISLFWADLQANADRRIRAFGKKQGS